MRFFWRVLLLSIGFFCLLVVCFVLFFFFFFCSLFLFVVVSFFSACKSIDAMMIVKLFIVFAVCGVVNNARQNVTMARRALIECCPDSDRYWENGKLVGEAAKSEYCPEKKEESSSKGHHVKWACGGFVFMVMPSLIL